ncbi:MAG: hypothetical protein ACM3ZE_10590 [Myxococcales bacterium]
MKRNAKPPSDSAARTTLALLTCGLLLNAIGCTNRADDCHMRKDCPPSHTSSSITEAGAGAGVGAGGVGMGGSSATSENACARGCAGAAPAPHCQDPNHCVACVDNAQCGGASPVCAPTTHSCVGCLVDGDCKESSKPLCNTATNMCVACVKHLDCKDALAARCNPSTGSCEPCATNADCEHIAQRGICDERACVTCTPENETPCSTGGVQYTCDPTTRSCTQTPKGSRSTCQTCVADSDCGTIDGVPDPNSHCISLSFQGAPIGRYCQRSLGSLTSCPSPYLVKQQAVSASRSEPLTYCTLNQSATTCNALLDFFAATGCTNDDDCGQGKGGLCRQVGMGASPPLVCTIPCATNESCTEGKYCSGTVEGFCK